MFYFQINLGFSALRQQHVKLKYTSLFFYNLIKNVKFKFDWLFLWVKLWEYCWDLQRKSFWVPLKYLTPKLNSHKIENHLFFSEILNISCSIPISKCMLNAIKTLLVKGNCKSAHQNKLKISTGRSGKTGTRFQ